MPPIQGWASPQTSLTLTPPLLHWVSSSETELSVVGTTGALEGPVLAGTVLLVAPGVVFDGVGVVVLEVPELDLLLDDFELDEHFAWLVRELDAGRVQPPPESAIEGPAISLSLGDACDVDPELLVAMCGPDGLGGEALSAAFSQDQAADVLRPGPVLAALTAQAVASAGSVSCCRRPTAAVRARRP